MGLEPAELARWTRFAAKGGIGRCIATCDCVAESADDLMFLKDDEITVLLQLPDREGFYLGYCEGVVGRFSGEDVRFLGKLKKPVMTKRVSSSSSTPQSGSHSPSWQSQTHRQSPSASPGGSLNANRSTDSPSDSIHMSPFPSVAAQSSPMSPLSSAYTSQPSTYDPLSPPPKTRTSLTTSSITISSSSTPVHPSSVPSPAVGGRSVSGPTGASASASSSIQPTGRPRTGSLDRTGSPSSGGHAYGQGQRYLASPLGASTVLTEDDDGDRKTGSSSRAGSGWHPEDGASHGNNNNFATLHERTLAQVDRSDGHRFLASETPLTASPRDASFNARAGEFSLEPPPRENSPLSRVSSPPSRINSPPSRVHSPPSYTTSPPTHTRTASPAVQQQSRTSSPAINQLHHSGTSSPAYHNSRTASPSIHQQYNPSPVSTPPPNSQPSLVSSPASASFVSAQNSASTLEGSPAPTIESTLTALTSPPMTSRNLPGQSQPRYTALAPAALTLSPTSQSQPLISPLRINKRSPGPGPTGAFNGVMPAQRSPPPTGALPVVPGSPPASGRDWAQGQPQDNYGQTLILPHSPFAQHFAPPHSARSFGTAPSSASVYSAPSMYSEASSPVGRDPSPGRGPPEKQAFTSVPSSLGPSPPSLSLAPSPYPDPAALQSLAPSPLSPASSSPSHTTTFAHRLGLASPASDPFEGREGWREGSGGTVGSSPATLGEAGVAEVGDNHTVELNVQNMHADADVEWKMNGDGEKGQEADHAQAQRAGVSIGLSLLEGLIGTYSDSEDESGSEYGDSNNNTTKRAKYLTQGANVANRVSVSESEDETVEGLGYARSEDDHTHVAAPLVPLPPPPPPQPIQQHETMRDQTPERHLSPTTSPTSPGFPEHSSPHGYASSLRHPRAADARSARSVRSDTLSSWEGDIYDNYRYSRAEGSVRSGISGTGGTESVRSFGVVPFTHTERRPSFDSVRSGGVGPWRERVDSGAGRKLDELVESGGEEEEESASGSAGGGRGSGSGGDQSSATTDANSVSTPPTDTETPGRRISKRHQHTRSADSDASVYTQNSRLSTLSRDLAMGGVLAGLGSGPGDGPDEGRHSPTEEDNGQGRRSSQGHKPSPLSLQKSVEPLLSTSWGSPVSSPTESSASLAVYTPLAGVMDNQGRGGWAPGQDMLKSAHAGVDDAPRSPNTMAGFATAMRMRLEEDRAQQAESDVLEDSDGHGLGRRIVVEDDEELPSRIMNSTFDSQAETETSLDHHSADHSNVSHTTSTTVSQGGILGRINSSPSPEPQIQTHLVSLVVANRSPTPGEENDSPLRDTQPPLPSNTSFSPPDPTPPATLAPPSTVSNDVPPAPSHLRPSLAELRAPGGAPLPGTNQRRSLFLPHPGAPKAPEGLVSPGPRYIAAQGHGPSGLAAAMGQSMQLGPGPMHPGQLPGQPARANVFTAIRMALAMSGRPPSAGPAPGPGPGLRQPPKGPTIYGRIDGDLASSSGPVPITFGIEAPKATAPPPGQVRTASTGPQGHAHPHAHGKSPLSGSAAQVKTKGPQAGAPATAPPRVQMMSKGGGAIRSVSLGPGASSGPSRLNPSASIPMPGATGNEQDKVRTEGEKTLGAPIPRANFFPKAAGMRPRSRSFSGFNSGTATEVPLPKRSREDIEISSLKDVQRARSPTSPLLRSTSKNISPSISPSSSLSGSIIGSSSSATTTPASSPSSANIGTLISSPAQKPGQVSVPSRPSPLSLSHVHSSTPSLKPSISSPTLKPPSSPLAQSVISTDTERPETGNNTSNDGATNVDAKSLQRRSTTLDERASLAQGLRSKTVRSTTLDTSPSVTASGRTISLLSTPHRGLSQELKSTHSMLDLHTASRTSTSDSNDSRPQVNLPPPSIGRQNSLRSKLSLPNLRRKQSRADDDYLTSPTSPTAPNMPGSHAGFSLPGSLMHDPEMLQVKDIEFELVRPNLAHHFSQAARTSEDSNVLGRDASLDIRQDASSFLRADSPAMSISSSMQQGAEGSLTQQTLGSTSSSSPGPMAPIPPPPPASAGESSVEAHRARELKWMSLMSSSPASQARKSKKVRRLLVEGVPSSVRYLVWTYLTDGKARFVKGVYSQLSSRGRVSAAGRIEEDVRVGFVGQGEEHLQGTKGGVLSLLSAYLNMVPDVQYSMGLSLIVGQLLLLAPEEDGFWIFVSIMDTHVRSYFSPSTTQMDVDASLFSRALENNDAQLAKKLFVDMSILPSALCAPWFSSLFVGSLPPEHLNRVWDLFLFEGIPFLLRVGVALLQCCRRVILEMTSDATVLRILRHPPISLLPPSPDAFLALVFAVKLKDDDVRKQRVKMEAQVKRQTQAPRTASTSGVGMISLPRT